MDGTNVSSLESKKLSKRNKSGVRGVFLDEKRQKYIATIGFKGKNYRLGAFDTLDEARKIREKAEEEMYEPFLEAYRTGRIQESGYRGQEDILTSENVYRI